MTPQPSPPPGAFQRVSGGVRHTRPADLEAWKTLLLAAVMAFGVLVALGFR